MKIIKTFRKVANVLANFFTPLTEEELRQAGINLTKEPFKDKFK